MTGSGFPLLLVHRYALSGVLFARVLERLSEHHTVITPDLREFGKSYAPGLTDSLDVYAEDLLALLNKLGIEQGTIAGMSMGAIALSMYAKAPDRFAGLMLMTRMPQWQPPPKQACGVAWRRWLKQKVPAISFRGVSRGY